MIGPAPTEGDWGARTSDALPLSFEVHDDRVENVRFTFAWGFCGHFESALPNSEPIRADDTWAYLDNRGPKVEATFVAADTAEGTITAPSRELPGCPRTEATFVAHPGPVPPVPIGGGPMARRHNRSEASGPGRRQTFQPLRREERGR